MKIRDTNKIMDILSMIEQSKYKNNITKRFFSRIKALIGIIPEIKEYFIIILKYHQAKLII